MEGYQKWYLQLKQLEFTAKLDKVDKSKQNLRDCKDDFFCDMSKAEQVFTEAQLKLDAREE